MKLEKVVKKSFDNFFQVLQLFDKFWKKLTFFQKLDETWKSCQKKVLTTFFMFCIFFNFFIKSWQFLKKVDKPWNFYDFMFWQLFYEFLTFLKKMHFFEKSDKSYIPYYRTVIGNIGIPCFFDNSPFFWKKCIFLKKRGFQKKHNFFGSFWKNDGIRCKSDARRESYNYPFDGSHKNKTEKEINI